MKNDKIAAPLAFRRRLTLAEQCTKCTKTGLHQNGCIRGRNAPTHHIHTDILYICGVCVGGSWCIHPTPCYPPMHQWCVALFLTAALIVAEAFSAGARLTAPNYEQTTCPTWGASVHRTRVSPLPVSGFFIRRKKVNETTEQPYETPIAPRPNFQTNFLAQLEGC